MKKFILRAVILLYTIIVYCPLAYAATQSWDVYNLGDIQINIPHGTKLVQSKHFDKVNDDVIGTDSSMLKMPNGILMLISIMNRSPKYMSPYDTEATLSHEFKKNVSLALLHSLGDGTLNVYHESETGTNELPAYLIVAEKDMYNNKITYLSYMFAQDNKVVNVIYFFKNDVEDFSTIIDNSIRSFKFK